MSTSIHAKIAAVQMQRGLSVAKDTDEIPLQMLYSARYFFCIFLKIKLYTELFLFCKFSNISHCNLQYALCFRFIWPRYLRYIPIKLCFFNSLIIFNSSNIGIQTNASETI